jgi:hypothetical protein
VYFKGGDLAALNEADKSVLLEHVRGLAFDSITAPSKKLSDKLGQ